MGSGFLMVAGACHSGIPAGLRSKSAPVRRRGGRFPKSFTTQSVWLTDQPDLSVLLAYPLFSVPCPVLQTAPACQPNGMGLYAREISNVVAVIAIAWYTDSRLTVPSVPYSVASAFRHANRLTLLAGRAGSRMHEARVRHAGHARGRRNPAGSVRHMPLAALAAPNGADPLEPVAGTTRRAGDSGTVGGGMRQRDRGVQRAAVI